MYKYINYFEILSYLDIKKQSCNRIYFNIIYSCSWIITRMLSRVLLLLRYILIKNNKNANLYLKLIVDSNYTVVFNQDA